MFAVSWAARRWGTEDRWTSGRFATHFRSYLDLSLCRAGTNFCRCCRRSFLAQPDPSYSLFSGIWATCSAPVDAHLPALRSRRFSRLLVSPTRLRILFLAGLGYRSVRYLPGSDLHANQTTGQISGPLSSMGFTGTHRVRHGDGPSDYAVRLGSRPSMERLAFADPGVGLAALRVCSLSTG